MSYPSIDHLQNLLGQEVFGHTRDTKKASGRALGTFIEIISYYLFREWGFEKLMSVERSIPEYGNKSITHNVELAMHPTKHLGFVVIPRTKKLTLSLLAKFAPMNLNDMRIKSGSLIDGTYRLKNGCVLAESVENFVSVVLRGYDDDNYTIDYYQHLVHPYAMIECKRVGIEEGARKGPQTIEKAKQGAYVANSVSSLQKIRTDMGEKFGVMFSGGTPIIGRYSEMLNAAINSGKASDLTDFTLSIGIVSNHGNWFTSDNQNKELRVLSQSYDWLLFLTDRGLVCFINNLLINPAEQNLVIRNAFLDSYGEHKIINSFTKSRMNLDAHVALCEYFHNNINEIEGWFNVISPEQCDIHLLKRQIVELNSKNWKV